LGSNSLGYGKLAFGALVLLIVLTSCISHGKVDPERGWIRILFIGDALRAEGMPVPLLVRDPLIRITPIPAEIATISGNPDEVRTQVRRFFRLYLPRTETSFLDTYDNVIIAATQADYPNINFQTWVHDGVIESGVGFLMADDPASFGGAEHGLSPNPSWADTPIGRILPVECAVDRKDWGFVWFRVEVKVPDNPMIAGLRWQGLMLRAHNRVYEREGSEVVLETDSNPSGSPVLIWMDLGKGRSVSFVNDWGGRGIEPFYRWPDASTFLINTVYFASKVPIPEDRAVVKRIRDRISHFDALRGLAMSTMEFADKFGANIDNLGEILALADEERRNVLLHYAEGEYEESLSTLDSAIARIHDLSEEADRAMKRALLWVYVSEWFVVAGTSLVCTFILWSLMVRRRLYREVTSTRLTSTEA
jgi:uncharacterized membrane protein